MITQIPVAPRISSAVPSEIPKYLISEVETDTNDPDERIAYLLKDYMQFKAARNVQRFVRGWLKRKEYLRIRNAVKIIERAWLKYINRRNLFKGIENELQATTLEHFHASATIIQKYFRGWLVREKTNNIPTLVRLQVDVVVELLSCISKKLHYLLKEHKIPGMYSIRNSNCLNKVEDLLSVLSYRILNSKKVSEQWRKVEELKRDRIFHEKCKFFTPAPYKGPNFKNYCSGANEESTFTNYDRRIYNILKVYIKGLRNDPFQDQLAKRKNKEYYDGLANADLEKKQNFCSTVIDSMQRWSIWDDNQYTIKSNVFDRPENVEFFLNEVSALLSVYEYSCHCKM